MRVVKFILMSIGTLVAGLFVLGLLLSGGSSQLQAKRYGYNRVELLNISKKPITIKKVAVNEREDCNGPNLGLDILFQAQLPAVLQIGDAASISSICVIVRIRVETDSGNFTYSFE